MAHPIYLQNEFKDWLVLEQGLDLFTSDLQCEYIQKASSNFLLNFEIYESKNDLFSSLESHVPYANWAIVNDSILEIIDFLCQKDISLSEEISIDLNRNFKSALFLYRDFLDFYMETKIEPSKEFLMFDEEEELGSIFNDYIFDFNEDIDTGNLKVDYQFELKDMYKILIFRLSIQDRLNYHIFYAFSFIKRFLHSKGEKQFFENCLIDLVDSIDIHLEHKKIKFKNISKLEIIDGQVFIRYRGFYYPLFTKLSDNKIMKPFQANNFNNIAIDYEIPILSIMFEHKFELTLIKEISTELKKHINGVVSASNVKFANNHVLGSEFVNSLDIEILKIELKFLFSKVRLQLMDSREQKLKVVLDIL